MKATKRISSGILFCIAGRRGQPPLRGGALYCWRESPSPMGIGVITHDCAFAGLERGTAIKKHNLKD